MVTWAQPCSVVRVIAASMTRPRIVSTGGVVTDTRLGPRGERPVERAEVDLLADPAVGTAPAVRDLRPRRTGREALALVTGDHVVGVAAPRALRREHLELCRPGRGQVIGRVGLLVRRRRVRRKEPVALARREVRERQVAVE